MYFQHGPNRAHLLDNEHLYRRSLEGSFSSLTFPSTTSRPTNGPHHFACDKGWTRQKSVEARPN